MVYSWPLEVVLADGTHLIGEYDCEISSSQELIADLLNTHDGFFAFSNTHRRELYVVSSSEIMAITIGMPLL